MNRKLFVIILFLIPAIIEAQKTSITILQEGEYFFDDNLYSDLFKEYNNRFSALIKDESNYLRNIFLNDSIIITYSFVNRSPKLILINVFSDSFYFYNQYGRLRNTDTFLNSFVFADNKGDMLLYCLVGALAQLQAINNYQTLLIDDKIFWQNIIIRYTIPNHKSIIVYFYETFHNNSWQSHLGGIEYLNNYKELSRKKKIINLSPIYTDVECEAYNYKLNYVLIYNYKFLKYIFE